MSSEPNGLYRLGGLSLIGSGILFLARYLLEVIAGPPPSSGAEIVAWAAAGRVPLAWVSEVLFFATALLVPAVIAIYASLAGADKNKAAVGCGIVAMAMTLLAALLVVHGRLVYPVYGIRLAPGNGELVVAIYHGGMHAVWLLLAIATLVLSLAMRSGPYGRGIVYLGYTTAVADVIGSYPWLIGPVPTLASQVLFTAWFVAVGAKLLRWG
jgi:hypothetical protein